jgi:hypothetical protein
MSYRSVAVRVRASQRLYMTVHGMQQQLQSSVLMHEHLPGCGLTMEPAVDEMELEAGIL